MKIEETKVVAAPEESEENVVEIADLDANLKEQDVKDVKKAVKEKVVEKHVLTEEQEETFQKILDAAKMPVQMSDADFKLGENELDIRYLSTKNRTQMVFRSLMLNNIYLKQTLTTLVDILRSIFLIADAMGVKDIVGKTDEILERLNKQIKENLNQEEKTEEVKA